MGPPLDAAEVARAETAARGDVGDKLRHTISPVHTCVPGRARLHIAGLRHSHERRCLLERGLRQCAGVDAVSASTDTGNVLIQFAPSLPLSRVVSRLDELLERGEAYAAGEDAAVSWYARDVADVARELGTSPSDGLSAAAAERRLQRHGPNTIREVAPRSAWEIVSGQLRSLPVALLCVGAAVSLATGGLLEACAIGAVLVVNAAIGSTVEMRSERTILGLSAALPGGTRVVRDRELLTVDSATIVPGDLLVLERGAAVAADARVVAAHDLTISEAMLTGESAPVTKRAAPLDSAFVPLGERSNMIYRGTIVTGGSGRAIATTTGPQTEMGRIQALVQQGGRPETPSQRQLAAMGRDLVWLSLGVCGLVFGVGLLRGFALLQMFRSAVSLAVASVPEGLPAIATTTLALGIEEMRRHHVLVRRVDAVETLASVRLVCFDKTGTLTYNSMRVDELVCERLFRADHDGVLRDASGARADGTREDALGWLFRTSILCSETQACEDGGSAAELIGSSTENALVRAAFDAGLDLHTVREAWPRRSIRYRSESYRFMATTHAAPDGGGSLVAVKGSPPEVLELCDTELCDGARRPLDAERRQRILGLNAGMAERALRVLGFAFGRIAGEAEDSVRMQGLTWVGLAGMSDPIRPGMAELMQRLRRAGVRPIVMTGDQVATARAVARQLGLAVNDEIRIIDTDEVSRTNGSALARAAYDAEVFARVSPAQKVAVVRALQSTGAVVAMVGDGINDSPALKAADVGIAMGANGAAPAREIADIVLETDDLSALALAIERGRATHLNVRRSVNYLLGTNLSEIAVMLAGTAAGLTEPLSVMQLLWINLVSDVLPGLGLAFEPPPADLMQREPMAANGSIIRREDLLGLAQDGAVIAAGSLGACLVGVARYGATAEARTMTFGSLVTAQLLHALTCRAGRGQQPVASNPRLNAALVVAASVQAAAFAVPGLRRLMGVAPLGPLDLAVTVGTGVLPYFINEARRQRRGREPKPLSLPAPA